MNHRLGASVSVAWGVAGLVFAPAIVSQAAWGLRGSYAKVGVVVVGLVLVALAGALFSTCLRLSTRGQASSARSRLIRALAVGSASAAAVALTFVPLALALRAIGMAVPAVRYKLATFEQFLYAVALNPVSFAALVLLLPLAVAWAYRLQTQAANVAKPAHANEA